MKGFQIFFETVKSQLQSRIDVIVSVIHFMLVDEDFVCVGIGEEFVSSDATGGSELLPTGWNSNQTLYSLKYRSRNDDKLQLLFKGIVADDLFIASVLPMNSSNIVHSISIQSDQYITPTWNGSYTEAFVDGDVKQLADLLRKEMLNKLRNPVSAPKASSSNNQEGNDNRGKSILEEIYVPPRQPGYGPNAERNPYPDPFFPRIGGNDLDPLHRGIGGGMLYDPFGPGGRPMRFPGGDPTHPPLPPGAIPPGSRYDPIGPPMGPRRQFPPDPDHFPPPGGFNPFL